MRLACMGNIEEVISDNERSVQDKTMEEICKMQGRWYHKGPRRLDYWYKNIEWWFTKIRSSYWWCEIDDPYTVQPTWIIREHRWKPWRQIRWWYLYVYHQNITGQGIIQVQYI